MTALISIDVRIQNRATVGGRVLRWLVVALLAPPLLIVWLSGLVV